MSWDYSDLERLRMDFVLIAREEQVVMSEACRQFGISRKTGYKWLRRYEEEGLAGLSDRSRCPHNHPQEVSGEVVLAVVRLRQAHPFWGPKKLRALLQREGIRREALPSVATVARVLKRAGLSDTKGRGRPRRWMPDLPVTPPGAPNEVWTVDFKGWWRTGEGTRCEPLTVRDLFSRYLLCLRPLKSRKSEVVQEVFQELFERYGLPRIIRSDNGGPFASLTGPYGLTSLSAWWRSLGVALERIEPGHPEQNGAHERMHLDIAREIQATPSPTWEEETRRLEAWRVEYNSRRPHEALGMKSPGECYRSSRRRLTNLTEHSYPEHFERRLVRPDGYIKLDSTLVFVSEALRRHEVAVEPLEGHLWRVCFYGLELGTVDLSRGNKLEPPDKPETRRR